MISNHTPAQPPRGGAITRGHLLRGVVAAGAAGGGVAALGTSLPRAGAKPSRAQDVDVLNLLLALEQAQDALYTAALRGGRLEGDVRAFAEAVAPQEREHVAVLQRRLGSAARKPPRFSFENVTGDGAAFTAAAIRLEELAVASYVGQGPNLTAAAVGEAARIASVEARHAAWIRAIAGELPAPRSADEAKSPDAVTTALREEGFVR